MSGHSKWSTIKHKKAKTDQQRGKVFSKVAKEITQAARLGGGDPSMNPRLRLAIQKSKEANMPNDNVTKAIHKGAGGGDGVEMEEAIFEAYAPNGVALLIETMTDNKQRTVPNIKAILTRSGGSMATPGAVSYLFNQKGLIIFEPGASEEAIMEIATEEGAEDIDTLDDGSIEVKTDVVSLIKVKEAFEKADIPFATASLTMIPSTMVSLTGEQAEKLISLIEKLEEDDDVQEVHSNADLPDEITG
ncbi:MAG: YebC/PmpR family DNA-binding regulatory protein [Candidatus Marinamargulisbacteria bacterium]|jgi:YebC/PmpR family DNA-binding regulatory protein